VALAFLAYVGLNPVRAAKAKTPESSDYTSVQRRIRALQAAGDYFPAEPSQLSLGSRKRTR